MDGVKFIENLHNSMQSLDLDDCNELLKKYETSGALSVGTTITIQILTNRVIELLNE